MSSRKTRTAPKKKAAKKSAPDKPLPVKRGSGKNFEFTLEGLREDPPKTIAEFRHRVRVVKMAKAARNSMRIVESYRCDSLGNPIMLGTYGNPALCTLFTIDSEWGDRGRLHDRRAANGIYMSDLRRIVQVAIGYGICSIDVLNEIDRERKARERRSDARDMLWSAAETLEELGVKLTANQLNKLQRIADGEEGA